MSATSAPDDRGGRAWSLVVPVKPAAVGKSRLAVPGVERASLARAIALDTIAAAARSTRVAELIVVTDDTDIGDALAPVPFVEPARTTAESASAPEEGRTTASSPGQNLVLVADPGRGLNAAIAAGLATASAPCSAAMLGDLPALRPADLDDALARAAGAVHLRRSPRLDRDSPGAAQMTGRALAVADADGTGTTLLAHAETSALRFGRDSYARHLAAGAMPLDLPASSTLRQDVDTAAHLAAAHLLGLGPRTASLLA